METKEDKIIIKCPCYVLFLALEDDEGKNNDGISFSSSTGPAWAGSERDYTYDEVGHSSVKLCNAKLATVLLKFYIYINIYLSIYIYIYIYIFFFCINEMEAGF